MGMSAFSALPQPEHPEAEVWAEPSVTDAARVTKDRSGVTAASRCRDRHHLRKGHAGGGSLYPEPVPGR